MQSNMNQTFNYSKAVQALGDRIKPNALQYEVIDVNFTPASGILKDFAEVEFAAIEYHVQSSGGVMPAIMTLENFKKYCNTFVVSRIAWVRGDSKNVIVRPEERILVPSLLDSVLKNIGVVYETSLGLTLNPTIDYDAVEVLTADDMRKIGFYLSSIKEYIGSLGYIKDKTGCWDFMSMQIIDDVVQNFTDHAHPAYAILASIVAPKWVVSTVMSPRVRYGDLNFFKGLLWELTSV